MEKSVLLFSIFRVLIMLSESRSFYFAQSIAQVNILFNFTNIRNGKVCYLKN